MESIVRGIMVPRSM